VSFISDERGVWDGVGGSWASKGGGVVHCGRRRAPGRASQGRARSWLQRAKRACSGLEWAWPAGRPLEALLVRRWPCGAVAGVRPWACGPDLGQAGPDLVTSS
jgi:hypothetical protein